MNAAAGCRHQAGVEKSPILAPTKCHKVQIEFRRNSLKTKESAPCQPTHFFKGQRPENRGGDDE
jgi:hypothetical protein